MDIVTAGRHGNARPVRLNEFRSLGTAFSVILLHRNGGVAQSPASHQSRVGTAPILVTGHQEIIE